MANMQPNTMTGKVMYGCVRPLNPKHKVQTTLSSTHQLALTKIVSKGWKAMPSYVPWRLGCTLLLHCQFS